MKLFEGCTVQSKSAPELNGLKVTRTIKWCYDGSPNSTLYEVVLENGKHYQLYEDEMQEAKS